MILLATILAATFTSVQVGSFSDETRALHVVEDLRAKGYDAYFLRLPSVEGGESTWKVRVGTFPDPLAAHASVEKIKALGFDGAFVAPTDLAETQSLSSDIIALVGAFGAVNPGRIPVEGNGRRLSSFVQDYTALFLLAAGESPGKKLSDLAVWDANPDNEPELFVVLDGARAYALFWRKAQARYELQLLVAGSNLSIGEMLDLTPGPEKFIAFHYDRGGELYREKGYRFYRWEQARGAFTEVGEMPLEVVDAGEEAGMGIIRHRVIAEKKSIDEDPDREVLVDDTVESGGTARTHRDVWDWHGGRLERVDDPAWFERLLEVNPSASVAAEGLFGVGVDKALAGDLAGAEKVFQTLVSRHPEFEESKRAQQAIAQIGERRERSRRLDQTGFDEMRAGAAALAAKDLLQAVVQDPGNASAWYNLAVCRAALDDTVGAARALRKALAADRDGSARLREKAKQDPELGALRETPEFKEMLE